MGSKRIEVRTFRVVPTCDECGAEPKRIDNIIYASYPAKAYFVCPNGHKAMLPERDWPRIVYEPAPTGTGGEEDAL
jgi:hypothetical protein